MKEHNLFLYALDPTHVGAGGYRLGRVDNTVMRDAATNLPKLPGSSISGACRAAAIYSLLEKEEKEQASKYARETLQNQKRSHKGEEDPVAKIFGYSEGDEQGKSQIGMVGFRDAHIFAFPVSTMNGPRWITTPQRLRDAGVSNVPELQNQTQILVHAKSNTAKRLNLGWLLLDTETAEFSLSAALAGKKANIERQLVIVDENLFPSIVNANLEVRTSVSIDFETGAGAKGALFTYEAVPRGTIYQTAINFDDDRFASSYEYANELVKKAMDLACRLGFGGMTTRGFGRMEAIWGEVKC